jgi:hypothetical protein
MKKLFGFVLFILLCAAPAFGQSANGTITAQGSTCTTPNACVVLNLLNTAGGATITLGGTFSATLQFEVSGDYGVTWVAASTASSTSAGVTNISVAGYTNLRVRCSAYTSGTVNVTLYSGAGSIRQSAGGSGTVTSVLGSSPIASDGSTTTPTISCPTCVTATTPGVGLAHFAGSTQAVTSSAVNLAGADVTGQLPIGNVGSAGLSGTAPITISAAGAIACATCNTSAAAITSNVLPKGSGGAQGLANSSITDSGTLVTTAEPIDPATDNTNTLGDATHRWSNIFGTTFTCGVGGTTSCVITGSGSTSGTATITWPATAGTPSNPFVFSNALSTGGSITATGGSTIGAAQGYFWSGRSNLTSGTDGVVSMANNASNSFTRLTIGLDTASYPALCRSGTNIIVGLAGATCTTLAYINPAGVNPGILTPAFSTTPAFNFFVGTMAQFACTTSGSAITPSFSGYVKGAEITVVFVQNGTTPCTWAWPSTVHGAVAVSATLSSVSVEKFVVSNNATDIYLIAATVGTTGGTP